VASVDLKKVYRDQYRCPVDPVLVQIPDRPFLMVEGSGDPNVAPAYAEAVGALYAIAYGLRAAVKAATGDAFTVMPLEGLWWADDMERFSVDAKSDWRWTMMISVPPPVTAEMFRDVAAATTARKQLVAGDRVRFESFEEGRAAQVMHLGPYATEVPSIEKLHAFIAESGLERRGKHHEIYLTDPRRAAPEKNRTILRQPVR